MMTLPNEVGPAGTSTSRETNIDTSTTTSSTLANHMQDGHRTCVGGAEQVECKNDDVGSCTQHAEDSSEGQNKRKRQDGNELQMPQWYQARRRNLTKRQKAVLRDVWPKYGRDHRTLKYNEAVDWDEWFNLSDNAAVSTTETLPKIESSIRPKLIADVGFGIGDSILQLAEKNPSDRYLGIEIYRTGHAHVASACDEQKLTNVRLFGGEVTKFLQRYCGNDSFDRVQIYFPDPFSGSESDFNCRLLSGSFLELLAPKMRSGGILHIASDVGSYLLDVLQHMMTSPNDKLWRIRSLGKSGGPANEKYVHFDQLAPNAKYLERARVSELAVEKRMGELAQSIDLEFTTRPAWRPLTKFEDKALVEGRFVWDLEVDVMSTP